MKKIIGKIINLFRTHRWEVLTKIINENRFTSYAEIGIWKGKTIKYLLKKCKGLKKIYCVDNYINNNDLYSINEIAKAKNKAKPLFKHPKIIFIEETSKEASEKIKDNSLDIIFIDTNHTYNECKNDIIYWYPKLKRGGILCGHNYEVRYMGVIKAVSEKFYPINLEPDSVWWVKGV